MSIIYEIFGEGKDLSVLQMSNRGILIFFIAWLLLRITGRRSFGLRTPLDNIISILLGAILSRAVTGASPFIPVIVSSLVIVLIHRLLGWLTAINTRFARVTEGEKILLFENGKFIDKNLKKGLVCEEDLMQGIRSKALTDDLGKIERVYMERNGEISVIKKPTAS
jgi:uncharacterized membrane protein YcaP (DUF421 family)